MAEIDVDLLKNCSIKDINLSEFSHCQFLTALIISGCDYLDGLKGYGLTLSFRGMKKHRTLDAFLSETKKEVPRNYYYAFM